VGVLVVNSLSDVGAVFVTSVSLAAFFWFVLPRDARSRMVKVVRGQLSSFLGGFGVLVGALSTVFGVVLYAMNYRCTSIDARMQLCTRTLQDVQVSNVAAAIILGGLSAFITGAYILRRRSLQ